MSERKDLTKVIEETQVQIVSQLYHKLCNCRRDFEELDQILETKFHLDECPYKIILERQGVKFSDGND